MEDKNQKIIEDSNCCFVGKPGIGKTILFFCSLVLLWLYFIPEDQFSFNCNSCSIGKIEPKAVIVCFSFFKIPYTIDKRTLCRCNKCKKGTWVNLNRVEKKLNYNNHWGSGSDFDCPFCNGKMKSKMFSDSNVSADRYYQCDLCSNELMIIHCIDRPLSWAETYFKNVDQEN